MPTDYTERGFANFAEFTDSYGAKILVRQSSNASMDAVWVFIDGGEITDNKGSAHLTVEQAIELRDALTDFIEWTI